MSRAADGYVFHTSPVPHPPCNLSAASTHRQITVSIMPAHTRYINVDDVEATFRDRNVVYAGRPVLNFEWYTGCSDADYVVSNENMDIYKHGLRHDPKNTPPPEPLKFGIIASLSPHENCLVPETTATSTRGEQTLGEGTGVFVDYLDGAHTQWHETWLTMIDVVAAVLPLDMEATSASGLFRVVRYNQPALTLSHRFFWVSFQFSPCTQFRSVVMISQKDHQNRTLRVTQVQGKKQLRLSRSKGGL